MECCKTTVLGAWELSKFSSPGPDAALPTRPKKWVIVANVFPFRDEVVYRVRWGNVTAGSGTEAGFAESWVVAVSSADSCSRSAHSPPTSLGSKKNLLFSQKTLQWTTMLAGWVSDFIHLCLETRWLGKKSWFLYPGTLLYGPIYFMSPDTTIRHKGYLKACLPASKLSSKLRCTCPILWRIAFMGLRVVGLCLLASDRETDINRQLVLFMKPFDNHVFERLAW